MKKITKKIILGVFLVVVCLGIINITTAATSVSLGTADSFAVLAGSGITNTGPTTIIGNIGTFPTVTQTSFASIVLTGTNHVGDGVTQGAKTDLVTAYNDAAGQASTTAISSDLGGQTLAPGVYNSGSSIGLTGTVTLDGGGNPNAVFIFQAGSTLTTASDSHVNLINNAQACNVFWQIGSSATIGTNSDFKGNIIAFSSITDNGGSTFSGRLLARNASVTLNNSSVAKAICGIATLRVTKVVTNDNGGTKTVASFPLFIDGMSVTSGIARTTSVGLHTVSETIDSGYLGIIGGDCAANGTITLVPGDVKICTITNDDIAPSASSGSVIVAPSPVPPLISVIKVPSPLSLPTGPKAVIPKLPNTGLHSDVKSTTLNAVIILGIFTGSLLLYIVRKKSI